MDQSVVDKKRKGNIKHLKIWFDGDQYITVTGNHLLYAEVMEDEYVRRADQLNIGSTLFVMDGENGFVEKKVTFIETVVENITFAPATMNGTVVVSNVLASTYDISLEVARKSHAVAAFPRFLSQYVSEWLAAYITEFHYYYVFETLTMSPIIVSIWTTRSLFKMFK